MREETIRPEHMMREYAVLFSQDRAELLKWREKFVIVSCPACGCSEYKAIFIKDKLHFVSCDNCQTVFINPRPDGALLEKYYNNARGLAFWNEQIFPASEPVRRKSIFRPRANRVIELCTKYKVNTNIIIDVGAGFGTFCEEIQKTNCFDRVVAVEPNQNLARTCEQKGIEVIAKPIEKVRMEGIDVITSFELIEHLFSPKNFLYSCSKCMDEGGLFICTTPNIKGFDLLTLGKLSDNIGGPNHLNYFHPDSLKLLLESCGFEVIETLTPGKLDAELVRKKVLSNELDVSTQPFLQEVLINSWDRVGGAFQQFLADNLLSSHMWIVARKT